MFDIRHDSSTPIHEQITEQIWGQIASGALEAGARLVEHRAFAQELLTNPRVTALAYADLEEEGVLAREESGAMTVTAGAGAICRGRSREAARERIRRAVAAAFDSGLTDAEVLATAEHELAACKAPSISIDSMSQAIKNTTHEPSHRDSQGIQDLSRKTGPGQP
jgi:DNA-binding transcriptional regulator YhcF (GntR family)